MCLTESNTFTNPLLKDEMVASPRTVVLNDTYYMLTHSKQYNDGFNMYNSTDLINWNGPYLIFNETRPEWANLTYFHNAQYIVVNGKLLMYFSHSAP